MIYEDIETKKLYIVKLIDGYRYKVIDSEGDVENLYYLPKTLSKIYNFLSYESLKEWLPSEPSTKFLNEEDLVAKVYEDGSVGVFENSREYVLSDEKDDNYRLGIDDRWDDFVKNIK